MQRIRTNKFECTCKVCNKKFFAKTTLAEICSTEGKPITSGCLE